MKTIPIGNHPDLVALVDDEDYDRVSRYNWSLTKSKTNKTVYACRYIYIGNSKSKPQSLHRFVMNAQDDRLIDHRNGNGLDCRKDNLRFATQAQNLRNAGKRPHNKSGYKGVHWSERHQKWVAQIRDSNGKKTFLGHFDQVEAAARAYDAAAIRFHGEFAHTNF